MENVLIYAGSQEMAQQLVRFAETLGIDNFHVHVGADIQQEITSGRFSAILVPSRKEIGRLQQQGMANISFIAPEEGIL